MRIWLMVTRKLARLSQGDVAKAAGVSQACYSLIENGKKNPSVKTAKAIAGVLGFRWEKFFEDKEVKKNASPEAAEILQHEGHQRDVERKPDAGAGDDAHV